MGQLTKVQELSRRGRFAEAFRVLEQLTLPLDERLMADSLRVELLERTGRYVESKALAEHLLRSPRCLASQRCASFMALGYSAFEHGFIDAATNHFQKALSAAEVAGDLRAVCACQLRLMNLLADRSGHQVVAPLLAQVRRNVTQVGEAPTTAALHIGIAELEAKRGLTSTASKHVALAKNLLQASENIYLEGVAENIATAISIMRSEPFKGIEHGERAVLLAADSGCTSLKRATLGNLGNLHLLTGRFDVARQYFAAARAVFPATGALSNGALESLAVLSLAEGRLTEANELLNEIRDSVKTQADWMIYANRHSRLTLAEVMARSGKLHDALEEIERVLELAQRSGDVYLHMNASLNKAEMLMATARVDDALTIFRDTAPLLPEYPPDMYARHQRGMALAFLSVDQIGPALRSLERSKRTYQGLNNVHGELELTRAWAERRGPDMKLTPGTQKLEDTLQSVAALVLHVGHPRLIAGDLVEVLADARGLVSAAAVSRGMDGAVERIAMCGDLGPTNNDVVERRFSIGSDRDRSIEVQVRLRSDVESTSRINAITLLIRTVHDLERARAEREERLTLWPLEDVPHQGDQTVVLGQLGELMSDAKRVAGTNVNVLITGESGTGKEILARAIHRYSKRAEKPFIPFNCAAVPREMLESQLFGHRRGAFTGADRDNPGVIRAASHGTLLLDEIGELSPELQPKLLRFLESGEISPLGDPNPITVDVRIVAATNANLDQLVQDGRFREDLFYRLNVIRLTLPPLRERRDEIPALVHHFVARAAQEFGKSRIRVAEETMEHLIVYRWPGNVRQLNNELRRMVALSDSDSTLTPSALSKDILGATPRAARANGDQEIAVPLTEKLQTTLSRVEREMIKAALKTSDGRVDAAARALGISRKGLYLKRQRLGL